MDSEKWKKTVETTEEIVFGYCALREERKKRKVTKKARYYMWKERVGFVKAVFYMVGEEIMFEIIYRIFDVSAYVMSLRLRWLGDKMKKEKFGKQIVNKDTKGRMD